MRLRLLSFFLLSVITFSACQSDHSRASNSEQHPTAPLVMARITSPELNEISGMVASRQNAKIFWVHNDSGDEARLFALAEDGSLVTTVKLKGITAIDWEDITTFKDSVTNKWFLFIADIGDNRARRDIKTIYRIVEPKLDRQHSPKTMTIEQITAIRFRYPDGARDAETLMADPLTGDLYIVSKRENQVSVYLLPFPQSTEQVLTATFVTKLPVTQITAGDISADGQHIILKNYEQIFYWKRKKGATLAPTFAPFPQFLYYVREPQGEALCFAPENNGYFTISEMADKNYTVLYFYPHSF